MCWWKCSPIIWRRALVQPGRYHLLPGTFYRGRARGFVLRVYTPPLKSGGGTRADAAGVTLRALTTATRCGRSRWSSLRYPQAAGGESPTGRGR